MGKKKSVVFMTFITIVILVLCAVVAFPKVTLPGSGGIKKWNPAALQMDLGAEFEGGHYAYYYPVGVISETEYDNNVEALEEGLEDYKKTSASVAQEEFDRRVKELEEELEEYKNSYKQHGSLYLSTDADDCIFTMDNIEEVSDGFKDAFKKATQTVSARFAKRAQATGSTYRVSVVDDYALRIDISATENSEDMSSFDYASNTFAQFANLGALSFKTETESGLTVVDQLKDEGTSINDLIKRVSVKTQYKIAYLKITFTEEGKEMLNEFKANSEATSLNLTLGEESILGITTETINTKNEVEFGVQYEEQVLYAEALCAVINSALEEGALYINDNEKTPFEFKTPTSAEVRTYAPVYGENLIWVYVAILVAMVIACAIAIVKMGGFGVMNAYTSLSYVIITALCYAFISGGVFAVTLGSVFVFLAGLALTNVLHVYIYNAIKKEVALGKTVASSIKNGYKKTLWNIVDVYAVLLLGAIALLIGVASLNAVASQAVICVIAAAFCNLLWGRMINVMLFSASKDKYKYFRLVREDDEDDE